MDTIKMTLIAESYGLGADREVTVSVSVHEESINEMFDAFLSFCRAAGYGDSTVREHIAEWVKWECPPDSEPASDMPETALA